MLKSVLNINGKLIIFHSYTLIDSFVNNVQQNAQIFHCAILGLKHYGCNMFRSVLDHLQGGATSIMCEI
jgi:hypothetical protein